MLNTLHVKNAGCGSLYELCLFIYSTEQRKQEPDIGFSNTVNTVEPLQAKFPYRCCQQQGCVTCVYKNKRNYSGLLRCPGSWKTIASSAAQQITGYKSICWHFSEVQRWTDSRRHLLIDFKKLSSGLTALAFYASCPNRRHRSLEQAFQAGKRPH